MNQRMLVFSSIFEGRSLQLAPVGKMGGGVKGAAVKGVKETVKGGKEKGKGEGATVKERK